MEVVSKHQLVKNSRVAFLNSAILKKLSHFLDWNSVLDLGGFVELRFGVYIAD